jgi:hypothetical protein
VQYSQNVAIKISKISQIIQQALPLLTAFTDFAGPESALSCAKVSYGQTGPRTEVQDM